MILTPILSIILPCYNVEKYIAECLDSIYSQGVALDKFEVICVNDCSPDRSVDIIKEYQLRYENLHLIHHNENKRAGGARNTGIECAKGSYIWFVDSDDTIVDGSISLLIDKLELSNQLDILLFNYNLVDWQCHLIRREMTFDNSVVMDGVSFLKTGFRESFCYHLGFPWRMIFRRELLLDNFIRFAENILYGEETVIFPKSILFASRVLSITDLCYNYRVNPESISSRYDANIPAELIYQHSFLTGLELLQFAEEVRSIDSFISEALRAKAISSYINGFIIKLLRTSYKEKREFYRKIEENIEVLEAVEPHLNRLNRFVCNRYIGYYFLALLTIAYNIKRKR
ncbi:MAG: glycosyltransferase [Rikenellaceae bacterium]